MRQPLLKEDEANAGKDRPYCFGNGFEVDYTIDDEKWVRVDRGNSGCRRSHHPWPFP